MMRHITTPEHLASAHRGAARTKAEGGAQLETELGQLCRAYGMKGVRKTLPFKHTDETDLAFAARFRGD